MKRTYSQQRTKPLPSSPPTKKQCTSTPSSPHTPLFSSSPSQINCLNSSPPSSPIRTKTPSAPSKKRIVKRIKTDDKPPPKLTQLHFNFNNSNSNRQQCKECGMNFQPTDPRDVDLHKKFHSRAFDGREWSKDFGKVVSTMDNNDKIYRVDTSARATAKRAVEHLMRLVNTELDAPEENCGWRDATHKGAAFVYVRKVGAKLRAVGIVVVEKTSIAKWMGVLSGELISNDQVPVLMGISRIYTARNFRMQNIAYKLLETARSSFIYGVEVKKSQVAWSQPSESGGKVADKWCGVTTDNERRVLTYVE